MVEHREGTTTEGRGLGSSFAADNVDRGDANVKFIKRRPSYPWGDDPRGREVNFVDQDTDTFRAYRGLVPIEGQKYDAPLRYLRVGSTRDLRPNLPRREPDFQGLDIYKAQERELLRSTDFQALFPSVVISLPSPGSSFSPGSTVQVNADAVDFRGLFSATLFVNDLPVDRHVFDRRDQESIKEFTFIFYYQVPSNQILGPMALTVAVFNVGSSARGIIADDAVTTTPDRDKALGTLNGGGEAFTYTDTLSPKLEQTGFLRTPEGTSSITINIV